MRHTLLPAHRITTAHLQSAYPFIAESGLGGRGVFIGQDMAGGGAFCYDPFVLYEQGVLTDPNMVVMGHLGRGKSSLIKTYVMRQHVFGRRTAIMDPKGEYGDLAKEFGVEPVRLTPGGNIRINPLDSGPRDPEVSDEAIAARQETLLTAVAEATLNRRLLPAEQSACRLALDVVRRQNEHPIIPDVAEAMLRPTEESARKVNTTAAKLHDEGRELALTLKRLCEGDLRGMFDSQTNIDIDWDGPLVVLDLSALHQSPALPILMTCAAAWLQAAFAHKGGGKRIVVVDEAWSILRTLGVARWMQANFKLARAYGVQNIIVLHRPSDLKATGEAGSEQRQIAEGLLTDAGTRVVYSQSSDEIGSAKVLLGLTSTEAEVLPLLGRGEALWRVGGRSFLVRHLLGRGETTIVDTDSEMTDKLAS